MRTPKEAAVAVFAAAVLIAACVMFAVESAEALHRADAARATGRTHVVEIRMFRFEPSSVAAAVGDTIRWINRDPVPHTVTARDSTWNSRMIEAAGEWRMVVRADVRREYFCIYHPTMTGFVRVAAAAGVRESRKFDLDLE